MRHIQASDVCVTPYTAPEQVSSGILSYCVGLDKPVLSTPFLYAQEILGDGRGVILPDFNNPDSMAEGIIRLAKNPGLVESIKTKLKPLKERMLWPNVAGEYINVERMLMDSQ